MYITLYYNVHIHIFCAVCLILESELKWATRDSSKYYVGYENIQQPQYVSTKSHRVFNAPLSLCWNVGYTCRYYQIQKRPKIIKFYSCAEHILFRILKLSLKTFSTYYYLVVAIRLPTYNWFANQPFIQWRTYDLKYY